MIDSARGIRYKLADVCEQTKQYSFRAARYLDTNNIIFFSNTYETSLVKITRTGEIVENMIVSPDEQLKQPSITDYSTPYSFQITKGGNGYPVRSHTGWYAPLAASPDKKKIAFLSRYPDCSKFPTGKTPSYIKDYVNEDLYVWLCVWDMETNEVQKIITLPESYIVAMPFTLQWSPEPNSGFVSFYSHNRLCVVDIFKKTVKQLPGRDSTLNVIRWSPDGSMLGFLDDKGELYIYNVAKDTTTKINSDKDCFNFVWVK